MCWHSLKAVGYLTRVITSYCFYSSAYCLGDHCCKNISDTNASAAMIQLCGCVCVDGDVVIDFFGLPSLVQSNFSFLSNLENVTGIFILENAVLSSRIEIPRLKLINNSIDDNDIALSVVNISGGDIIFPKLSTIKRGDAEFEIMSDGVCGFHRINWTVILTNGILINNNTTCKGNNTSVCQWGYVS